MATGIFYVRPSSDISLGHPVYPDTLGAGYLAINEEVSDGTATYIGATTNESGAALSFSSSFKMALCEDVKIQRVNSASFNICSQVNATDGSSNSSSLSEHNVSVKVLNEVVFDEYTRYRLLSGGEQVDPGNLYGTISDTITVSMPNLISAINNYINSNGVGSFPEIQLDIESLIATNNGTKSIAKAYVTQVYIELECEYQSDIGIHHKVNSLWKPAIGAYQKVDGVWSEITAEECKEILLGGLITKQ